MRRITYKRILKLFLVILFFMCIFNQKSYAAGSQKWNSLDFDVTLNSDGSMTVIETWDIYVSETNTLFKSYELDDWQYSNITDVKVSCVDENGNEEFLKKINKYQYHVNEGCYYALQVDNNFEIAWNVGLDNSSDTRTYKLYYTVNDVVKLYNDCTELYWQFIGDENEVPGKNITGTIKLPQSVSNIEKLRVWGHGVSSGNIERTSKNLVTFSASKISAGTMLEIRVVTEENIYTDINVLYNYDKLDSILAEEQGWSDQTNETKDFIIKLIVVVVVINIVFTVFFASKIIKYKNEEKILKEKYPKVNVQDIEYFRDIPDEKNATPQRAMFMKDYAGGIVFPNITGGKAFSATILDLSLKGLVEFETINSEEIKIFVYDKDVNLPEEEEIIYDILKEATIGKEYITTNELRKYSRENSSALNRALQSISTIVLDYETGKAGNIDEERKEICDRMNFKHVAYVIFAILLGLTIIVPIFFAIPYICLIACIDILGKNIKLVDVFTERGKQEKMCWKGLKKYLENYSLLNEKLASDIVLWEKYLVYATAFGISKNVLDQLHVVNPELFTDNDYSSFSSTSSHHTGYWHMIANDSYEGDSFYTLSNSLESICTTIQNSSSSSSGSRRRR